MSHSHAAIIVITKRELSANVEFMSEDHMWSVEGDFGFLDSFCTLKESVACATAEIEGFTGAIAPVFCINQ